MKKFMISATLLGALMLTSCGTTGSALPGPSGTNLTNNGTTEVGTSLLGNVLGSLLGSSNTITKSDLIGTWTYAKADCVFETDNLLMKAGGEVAATRIESQLETQLSKIGIKKGSCTYTFNEDGTYTAVIGGYTLSGTYTFNEQKKTVTLTYLAGLGRITPHVAKTGNKISLLYESDKLLQLVQKLGKLSSNSTISGLSSLLGSYDGLLIGMELQK